MHPPKLIDKNTKHSLTHIYSIPLIAQIYLSFNSSSSTATINEIEVDRKKKLLLFFLFVSALAFVFIHMYIALYINGAKTGQHSSSLPARTRTIFVRMKHYFFSLLKLFFVFCFMNSNSNRATIKSTRSINSIY